MFKQNIEGNRDSFFENAKEIQIRKEKHAFKVYPAKDHQSFITTIWEQTNGVPDQDQTSGIDKTKLLIFKANLEQMEIETEEDEENEA